MENEKEKKNASVYQHMANAAFRIVVKPSERTPN